MNTADMAQRHCEPSRLRKFGWPFRATGIFQTTSHLHSSHHAAARRAALLWLRFWRAALVLVCAWNGTVSTPGLRATEVGESVAIVFNTSVPESRQVAAYYGERRQVPASQLFGFDLPATENITRAEFLDKLQNPLLKNLEEAKLFVFEPNAGKAGQAEGPRLVESRIRYLVLCFGVPTRILKDPKLVEAGAASVREELRRNEASVDSQLACLPLSKQKPLWSGPLVNPLYGTTNATLLHPTNGLLMVARLDGPTAAIARGLVDKALDGETNGLWGRAYFDARGLKDGNYKQGDDWIRDAADISRRLGFETVLDDNANTFPVSFPMSQIGIYAGWYDWNASGPFLREPVEFMPGAFAYHLHSFSAQTIRSPTQNWVGPLLHRGAAATVGYVDEPYLSGTLDLPVFLSRWIFGRFSLAEAAYAALNSVSWQSLVIGDPLYRPFARHPMLLHRELEERQSKLLEWSYLRVVNLNLALNYETNEVITYLEKLPLARHSAVLTEKLANLYWGENKFSDGLDTYERARKLDMTPQQKVRLLLHAARLRSYYGPDEKAFEIYQQFLKECPDYPDLLSVYQKILPLAQRLGKKEEVERCQREIKRLTPPAAAGNSHPQ